MRLYLFVMKACAVLAALVAVALGIALWIAAADGTRQGFEVHVQLFSIALMSIIALTVASASGAAALWSAKVAAKHYVAPIVEVQVERALREIMPTIGTAVGEALVTDVEARMARMLERHHARTMAGARQLLNEEEFVDQLDAALGRARSYGQTVESRLRAASTVGGTVTAINLRERG